MKTILALLLLLAATRFAVGAMTAIRSTQTIKDDCDVWVADQGQLPEMTNETRVQKAAHGTACAAYINGISNEMIGEITWRDSTHRGFIIGNFEDNVTLKQEILVFVDFVNQNPALLNKPATLVFRQSMEAANLYTYAPAPDLSAH